MSITGEPIPGASPIEVIKPNQILEGVGIATSAAPRAESLTIDQVKKELIDPRTISKRHDQEGRGQTAREILEARAAKKTTNEEITSKEGRLQSVGQQTTEKYQLRQQKAAALEQRLNSLLVRIKTAVGMNDKQAAELHAEIDTIQTEQLALFSESNRLESELQSLRTKQGEIPNARALVEAYYEKLKTQPLTNEEKRQFLKPEVLASLSDDEYVAVWRRLNSHFLSHVTRQGFRDHNAMFYHSAGLQEYHNGFVGILQDEKQLRPPLAIHGLRSRNEQSVREFIKDWVLEAPDEKEAKLRLRSVLKNHLASAPKYPDITAVHFANQLVANDYYGGEASNEIFFVYPTDYLASQHNFAFNGWEKDFTKPQSETKWNDVFVWPNTLENPRIPLDSGLVFLPEATLVDPLTGSKYASEIKIVDGKEKRVMVEDTLSISRFVEWGKNLSDQSPVIIAYNEYSQERNYFRQQYKEETCVNVFRQELEKLGFSADASASLGQRLFGNMRWRKDKLGEKGVLENIIEESGAQWKRAETTIPAKEYWEKYFIQHPELRPKHVRYYNEGPTSAIYEFLRKNNIGKADTSSEEGVLLGFKDHLVILNSGLGDGEMDENQDPRVMRGYKELLDTGDKIIAEHYKQ